MRQTVGKRHNSLKNICLLMTAIFLVLCLSEWIIRSLPALYCTGYRPSDNERLVYELYPNYQISSINATISAQGLNDHLYSFTKPSGVYRIAVVGDSNSFGWKVGSKRSFPKVLEELLNKNGGQTYQVINFSVPGYNTAQELELLKTKVIHFAPDMVILTYCNNDMHICNYIKPKINLINFLYNKSYLAHFVLTQIDIYLARHNYLTKRWPWFKKNILGMFYYEQKMYPYPGLEETIYIDGNPPAKGKQVPKHYHYMLGEKNYERHLSEFIDFLKHNKIEFISTGLLMGDALRVNKKLNVNILSFYDAYAKSGVKEEEVILSPEDWHMNTRGHQICAEYLYEMISRMTQNQLP